MLACYYLYVLKSEIAKYVNTGTLRADRRSNKFDIVQSWALEKKKMLKEIYMGLIISCIRIIFVNFNSCTFGCLFLV